MGQKKWYVVIVGKAVGVFTSWLEVAPLVVGVSGAQHQSFPTEEEATQAFRDEVSKGTVKSFQNSSRPEDDLLIHSSSATQGSPPGLEIEDI